MNEVSFKLVGAFDDSLGLGIVRFELDQCRGNRSDECGHRLRQPAAATDTGLVVPPETVWDRTEIL